MSNSGKESAQQRTIDVDDAEPSGLERTGTAQDRKDMSRLGKKQQLNRNFRFFSILAFTCVLMGTWEAQLAASTFGLINGGLAGLVWTYLGAYAGFLMVIASMAEMASMAPTSGGQYHWVSEFAPKGAQKFLSYMTGWVCVLGWQTGTAIVAFLAGTEIQGLLVLNYPSYVFERWHGTLLIIAIVAFSILFNTFFARRLPVVENVVLALHIFGFFAILITLWVTSERNSAHVVFAEFTDGGNWGSIGLSCLIGMLSPVFSFIGPDSAVHMSEELKDASRILPLSMMWTVILNGVLGWIMLVTFCFCIGDVQTALETPTGYPFIQMFLSSTKSHAGASIMTTILILLTIGGCINNVASASRQLWSFARDEGLPFSKFLAHVTPGWDLPLNAVAVSFVIAVLLSLINIGSSVAFDAIASLGVVALISSYTISISCITIKKLRGEPLPPSKWKLPKRYGLAINIISIFYLILVFIISFFPLATPVSPQSMNWNCLVYGIVVVFALIYYFIWGKYHYNGPVVHVKPIYDE